MTRIPDNPVGLGVTGALPGEPSRIATGTVAGSTGAAPAASTQGPAAGGSRPPASPTAQPVPDPPRHSPPLAIVAPPPVPDPASPPAAPKQAGIDIAPSMPDGQLGIPSVMLGAYQRAAHTLVAAQPGCHLSWSVLAGIGRIESGHASGGRVDAAGNTLGRILGQRLDGSPGMAAIPDTDHGVLDGDSVWDRAVGPMQFIPSSWRQWGIGNPNNIYDSTLAAGRYLCAGGADLTDPAQLRAAIYRYNHSASYVAIVLQWANAYLTGVIPQPSAPGPVPSGVNGNGSRPIISPAPSAAAAPPATTRPSPPPATPLPTPSPSPRPAPATTPATTTPNPTPCASPAASCPLAEPASPTPTPAR
ncbi:MAG: hypothetical protein JO287_03425 [Pseudonocardiales bacterium]|nr:hypothetical protein [Pseudonocardiales bacterium]